MKKFKSALSLVLCGLIVFSGVNLSVLFVRAANPSVAYLNESGEPQACTDYTVITTTTTVLNDAWYVVNGIVSIDNRITVSGNVHLILADGSNLLANKGITLEGSAHLYIYSQSTGSQMGSINADASHVNNCAGIGGTDGKSSGYLRVYGGSITAFGGINAAGIGGGDRGSNTNSGGADWESIQIYGGSITATGGTNGAGIGGGNGGRGQYIYFMGGSTTANGGTGASGVGGGYQGGSNSVVIRGGFVTAIGGGDINAFGPGSGSGQRDFVRTDSTNSIGFWGSAEKTVLLAYSDRDPKVDIPTNSYIRAETLTRVDAGDGVHHRLVDGSNKVWATGEHRFYGYTPTENDNSTHYSLCICGAKKYADHFFTYTVAEDTISGECDYCRYGVPDRVLSVTSGDSSLIYNDDNILTASLSNSDKGVAYKWFIGKVGLSASATLDQLATNGFVANSDGTFTSIAGGGEPEPMPEPSRAELKLIYTVPAYGAVAFKLTGMSSKANVSYSLYNESISRFIKNGTLDGNNNDVPCIINMLPAGTYSLQLRVTNESAVSDITVYPTLETTVYEEIPNAVSAKYTLPNDTAIGSHTYRAAASYVSLTAYKDISVTITERPTYSLSVEENSDDNLTIIGNGRLEDFKDVKVDGVIIDKDNYTLSSGSTIVKFKPEYVKTLSTGSHTFELIWTNGSASKTVNIKASSADKAAGKDEAVANTNDSSNIAALSLLLSTSVLGLIAINTPMTKRKKSK